MALDRPFDLAREPRTSPPPSPRLAAQRLPWHTARLSMMSLQRLFVTLLVGASVAAAADSPDLPKGLPDAASKDQRIAVLELMKANTQKYGSDAALLQGLLLTHSLQGEAVLTTQSTITGFEEREGRKYLGFRVESGVVLNDKTMDRDRRLERIWHVVLERTLLKYPKFKAPGDGLAVEISYNHREYERLSDVAQTDDDAGPVERAKFYLLGSDLDEFLGHRLGPQEFLGRSRVLVDERPVKIQLTEVTMPPRPATELGQN
jgi:hypothetical protein